MGIVSIHQSIRAPREVTWDAFTGFEQAPSLIASIESVQVLERGGESGLGLRFRETRRRGKRSYSEVLEVTQTTAPELLCIECDSCGGRFKTRFHFTEKGASTEVDVELSFKPRTIWAKICTPLKGILLGMCAKVLAQDMNDLASHLEGS